MDRTTTLREGISNKPFKEQLDYIWTYYKLHIIGILAIIFFVVSFIYTEINKKEVYCNITYASNSINTENFTSVSDKLNELFLPNNKKSIITLDYIFTDDKSNAGQAMIQKLEAEIVAKEIDIAIVNKDFFEQNFSSEIFLNLETLNDFSSLPLSNHKLVKKTDSNGNSATYGISVKNLKLLNEIPFSNDDTFIVVISNTQHRDAVINILKTLTT